MAQAVGAGARGAETEATQRLAADDYEEAATQALPRTQYERRIDPTMVAPIPVREREPAPARAQAAQRRPPRRNRAGRILLALLLLAAGVAAAVAAVSALDNGGISAPNESDVSSQVQELKSLIREHTQ